MRAAGPRRVRLTDVDLDRYARAWLGAIAKERRKLERPTRAGDPWKLALFPSHDSFRPSVGLSQMSE